MRAESESEAAWRGFFLAAISAGVGTVVGMIAGFVVGGVADTAVSIATGHEQLRFCYILAEFGTYVGLFLGIVVGIATGVSSASTVNTVEPSVKWTGPPASRNGAHVAEGVDHVRGVEEQGRAGDKSDGLGGAAAA
ncbi:MAG TPA: hypothetical protein VEX15_23800 [Nocardioidaceae bacterium]|nr:hypothetical protein [Nocardioidaceae bacterium]